MIVKIFPFMQFFLLNFANPQEAWQSVNSLIASFYLIFSFILPFPTVSMTTGNSDMGYMTMDELAAIDLLGSPDLSPIQPQDTKLQPPLIPLGEVDTTPQGEGAVSKETTPVRDEVSISQSLPNG